MKKIERIMLIYPPVTRPVNFSGKVVRVSIFFPLGIAYLAAVLEKTGKYEISVLDALIENYKIDGIPFSGGERIRYGMLDNAIAEKIRKVSPDVVGVACLFSPMQWDTVNVCRIVKKVNPKIMTIIGGAHAGPNAVDILEESEDVDFVIIGESEVSFVNLLEKIERRNAFADLDGIAFRKNGSIKLITKTRYIEDLDSIPFPARHLFDMEKYFQNASSHSFYKEYPYTQMITTRGCPHQCTFCALGAHWGKRQRMRTAENVLDEIEYLIEKYDIKEIHFEDDNLTADKDRAIELFNGMVNRGFNIKWHVPSGIAVNTLSEEILEKMKASGCYSVTLAIESGNQKVLSRLMKKPVNLKIVPGLVKTIRKIGIEVRGFFILGYPDETKETIKQTIEFAKQLELDWAYINVATPLPNTKMYETCIEKGYIRADDFDPIRSFHKPIIRTPEFSPEYIKEVCEEAIIDVCFKYNPNLLKYDINKAITDFKEVVKRYPHFDFANFYLGEAYLKKGKKAKAINAYKNTLSTNPSYQMAAERLKEFGITETNKDKKVHTQSQSGD